LGLAVSTKVDGQDTEACVGEGLRLLRPVLPGEAAAMNQHDGALSFAVLIGVELIAIGGWECNWLLRSGDSCQEQREQH
jgi:hypothetical protein